MKKTQSLVALFLITLVSVSSCTLLESEFPFEGTYVSFEENAASRSWDTLIVEETDRDTYRITRRGIAESAEQRKRINQERIYRLNEAKYDLRHHGTIIRPDGHDGSLVLGERRFKRIK